MSHKEYLEWCMKMKPTWDEERKMKKSIIDERKETRSKAIRNGSVVKSDKLKSLIGKRK